MSRRLLPPLAVAFTLVAARAVPGCEEVVAEPPFDAGLDADADADDVAPFDAFAPPDVTEPEVPVLEPDTGSLGFD